MDEPLRCKIRRGAHSERAATLALQQPLRSDRDSIERIAHDDKVFATGLRDHQPLAFAIEELDAKFLFQRLDLMADRPLRYTQLLGGAREALVAGRRLEGLEGVKRRQTAKHGQSP